MKPSRPGPTNPPVARYRLGNNAGQKQPDVLDDEGVAIPILENWETLPDGRVKGAVYGRKVCLGRPFAWRCC